MDTTSQLKSIIKSMLLEEEFAEYSSWVKSLDMIEESAIGDAARKLTGGIKTAVEFVTALAGTLKTDIKKLAEVFNQKDVYAIFKSIGWNINKFFDIFKPLASKYADVKKKIIAKLMSYQSTEEIQKNWDTICEWIDENIFKHLGKAGSLFLTGIVIVLMIIATLTGDNIFSSLMMDIGLDLIKKGIDGTLTFCDCFKDQFDSLIELIFSVPEKLIVNMIPGANVVQIIPVILAAVAAILRATNSPLLPKIKAILEDMKPTVPTISHNGMSQLQSLLDNQ